MKRKPRATRKQKTCKHCFHAPHAFGGIQWSGPVTYTCCWCGINELDTHGPYHPEKRQSSPPKVIYGNDISGGTVTLQCSKGDPGTIGL